MLPMQAPSGGWDSGVSVAVTSYYSTPASGATSSAYSSAAAVTSAVTSVASASGASSAPYTYATGSGSAAYTYGADPSSTAAYTYGADPSSAAAYTYASDPSSTASGTAAVKAAGNLAETDDEDLNSQVDYYKNKVRTLLAISVKRCSRMSCYRQRPTRLSCPPLLVLSVSGSSAPSSLLSWRVAPRTRPLGRLRIARSTRRSPMSLRQRCTTRRVANRATPTLTTTRSEGSGGLLLPGSADVGTVSLLFYNSCISSAHGQYVIGMTGTFFSFPSDTVAHH